MKILSLEAQGVRGLADGKWDFSIPGQQRARPLTVIVGARGSGKTSLLEAIVLAKEAIGAYGMVPRPHTRLRHGASGGQVRATFALEPDERAAAELASPTVSVEVSLSPDAALPRLEEGTRKLFERFSFDADVPKVEYFPDQRDLLHGETITDAKAEARLRPTRRPDKYAGLLASLVASSLRDGATALEESSRRGVLFADDRPDSLVTYRSAMAELVPELRLSGALASDGPASERLMFSTKSGEMVSAALLSAGQRQGILLAGTIVRLGLRRSLLLIDQPELHLHAADHESFVRAVERIAGDSQIILATGSSAVSQIGSRDQTIVLRRSGAS